jgi:hypothetical protein
MICGQSRFEMKVENDVFPDRPTLPKTHADGDHNVKVLFIAGLGRSGSTMLGNILGQVQGVIATGEVRYLWERGLGEDRMCGCGLKVRQCDFWQSVLRRSFGGLSTPSIRRMTMLRRALTRTRQLPFFMVPRLSRLLGARLSEYQDYLQALYRAIAEVSGSDVVVDSSNSPMYAYVLKESPGVDLSSLHLIRDSRAHAYSWQRRREWMDADEPVSMPRYGVIKSSIWWSTWNLAAEVLLKGPAHEYLMIRYEDLVDHLEESLREILAMVGLSDRQLPLLSERTVSLHATHTVAGNPMRFDVGQVDITADVEWVERMSPTKRWIVTRMTGRLLRRYGYMGER